MSCRTWVNFHMLGEEVRGGGLRSLSGVGWGFRHERADFSSLRANSRPEKADFRRQRGRTAGSSEILQNIEPLGPLPDKGVENKTKFILQNLICS